MFPNTFLSLHRSNKLRIPFVQGKFNAGGTGVLQFCGARNYQLIVSKRHPIAPREEQDSTADLWGFTLVRRLRPARGERSSMYVYLAPGDQVLAFGAESIRVLPGDEAPNRAPAPYSRPLEYGTCVKLYNYRWRPKSTVTTEARYEIERHLQAPCLPFRVTETRDYRANYSSGPHHQDSGEAKIRESTAGVSRKPSSDGKACGCSSKHLCGLTAWNT